MQAEGVRQAEGGHLESARHSGSECGVSGPQGGGVNVELASRLSAGFLPQSGAQVPRAPTGTALLGTSGISAPGQGLHCH